MTSGLQDAVGSMCTICPGRELKHSDKWYNGHCHLSPDPTLAMNSTLESWSRSVWSKSDGSKDPRGPRSVQLSQVQQPSAAPQGRRVLFYAAWPIADLAYWSIRNIYWIVARPRASGRYESKSERRISREARHSAFDIQVRARALSNGCYVSSTSLPRSYHIN